MIELSASGLADWQKCQRLWALTRYYEYEGPPSIWTAIGNTVHKTIQLIGEDDRPLEAIFKEQFKHYTKGVPTKGISLSRVKAGLLCSMGNIDWKKFKAEKEPKCELYFNKQIGDAKFVGYVDCLTNDNIIMEWKTTSKKNLPVDDHIQQGTIYKEMIEADKVYLVYFTWRNGQMKMFELNREDSHLLEIERVADEIATCVKKGEFKKTGNCKTCWERKECQARSW